MGLNPSTLLTGDIQHILAYIVVALAGALTYLFRLLIIEKDGRLADAKDVNEKVSAVLSSISQTVNMMNDKMRDGRR